MLDCIAQVEYESTDEKFIYWRCSDVGQPLRVRNCRSKAEYDDPGDLIRWLDLLQVGSLSMLIHPIHVVSLSKLLCVFVVRVETTLIYVSYQTLVLIFLKNCFL